MSAYQALFESIVDDLHRTGYSVNPNALPNDLSHRLAEAAKQSAPRFKAAGVGRNQQHVVDHSIRSDRIQWIDQQTDAGKQWLDFSDQLRVVINRHLFLGLQSFESHFAHYLPQAFYQRHVDAFKGDRNRVLSVVTYLNQDWPADAGGELIIYADENDQQGTAVAPQMGTLVVFLSDTFAHEVKPADLSRYSIAGWFRQN